MPEDYCVDLREYAYFVTFTIIGERGQTIGTGNGVIQVRHPVRTKADLDAITEWALNLTEERSQINGTTARIDGATALITGLSRTATPGED